MRRLTAWLVGATVVAAVGSTPVAFTHDVTMHDGDRVVTIKGVRFSQAFAIDTKQEGHWASGRRELTIMNTDPGRGFAGELQGAVAQWNTSGTDLHLTYAEGGGHCGDYDGGTTIAICYKELQSPVIGTAYTQWDGSNHILGGWIDIDPRVTDPTNKKNVSCHEIGHELGLGHPADGSQGPCDGAGNVRDDERVTLQEIYGHDDSPPPPPPPPPAAQCADGTDNDGDGKTDFPADPGCTDAADNDETDTAPPPPPPPPAAQCADGTDNDGDGKTDLNDPGCTGPKDTSELGTATCDDGIDNDADGKTDFPADPGCKTATDTSETDAAPLPPVKACSDGVDNDGDGQVDFPDDPGCKTAKDSTERGTTACDDGIDNDGDGKIDLISDPGCDSPADTDETDQAVQPCHDGIDNDADGKTDFPDDPGCDSATDPSEFGTAACDDGWDNDGDGLTDFGDDPDCENGTDGNEAAKPRQETGCSLGLNLFGLEVCLLHK